MDDEEKKLIDTTEKEVAEYIKKFSPEKTENDIEFIESLFNISTKYYEDVYLEFDSSFSSNEKNYIKIISNFFIELEKNIYDLKNCFCDLLKSKNYKSSMYLLRGLIENLLFNVYISHKLFNHLNKSDYVNFFNLFFKANYGHKQFSFKSYELIKSNNIFQKAIDKTFGGKIHINNCLEFYSNTNFKSRYMDLKKIPEFMNYKNDDNKFRDLFFNFVEMSIKGKDSHLQEIYFQLCEIIHPTCVIINSYNDETVNLNYRSIVNGFAYSRLIPNSVACQNLNINIIERIKKNKNIFVKEFDSYLNKKKN